MSAMEYATKAIEAVYKGEMAFCKFLSANDTGETGTHQCGIYVAKSAVPILFSEPGKRGENLERNVRIKWQGDFSSDARFVYYGKGTRNEYRITKFGRGFPLLNKDDTGALFILIKDNEEKYQGYFLFSEEEIERFLDSFGLSPTETNNLIEVSTQSTIPCEESERSAIEKFIQSLPPGFPSSIEMAAAARRIQSEIYDHDELIENDPDLKLLEWTELEYRLFKMLESSIYREPLKAGFQSVEEFISIANTILNRRKSRAGKSLEHHIAAIFDGNNLTYDYQVNTEEKKLLDFVFPSESAYHNFDFPSSRIITLAVKTTCKDRWRQILNEADRRRDKEKYLFTLQQGISSNQLTEMEKEHVILVVPRKYITAYPEKHRDRIWTLKKFIEYVRETESC